ncbi:MAG TPA: UDP-N-acetylmuramoyl-tripeptide--D-alanyl-D-alanine ligase [Gemmatimonadales bacterium]
MSGWDSARVARLLGVAAPAATRHRSIATDTRVLRPGDLFVALAGERFDGHDFLEAARAAGATGAVVRHGTPPVAGLVFYEVDRPLAALGSLANARRRAMTCPVVAITGTNGKTSTKEFVSAALGSLGPVSATRANQNNEIGVPLTILEAPPEAAALVVEAGASEPGEIGRLRAIVEPTISVVTNVTAGHVAGFGSIGAILTEKLALVDGVATAVVGTTPRVLAGRAREVAARVITAGLDADADITPDRWEWESDGHVRIEWRASTVRVPVVGRHLAENAMLALAVAEVLGVDPARAMAELAAARVPGGRCEVIAHGGVTVLHDAYNANPASLGAALETVMAMRGNRPMVILVGTMLELGAGADAAHRHAADAIVASRPDLVGAVGDFGPALERHRETLGDRLVIAGDPDTLGRRVAERLTGTEVVLIKASRGVRLEQVLPYLLDDREASCSTTS